MNDKLNGSIISAAPRNYRLRQTIYNTSDVYDNIAKNDSYIASQKSEIAELNNKLTLLEVERRKELKEHVSYRDSKFKRFGYKISGNMDKFHARAAKEEKEYHDVLERIRDSNDRLVTLNSQLDSAMTKGAELQNTKNLREASVEQIEEILDSIFGGPTIGYDDEDDIETQQKAAFKSFKELEKSLEKENNANMALKQANYILGGAMKSMNDALKASQMDMFGYRTADYFEREALGNCQMQVNQAFGYLRSAQENLPETNFPASFQTPAGNWWTDVFFDNIIFDAMFHSKIKKSKAELENIVSDVGTAMQKSDESLSSIQSRTASAKSVFDKLSNDLFYTRQRIIEQIAPEVTKL